MSIGASTDPRLSGAASFRSSAHNYLGFKRAVTLSTKGCADPHPCRPRSRGASLDTRLVRLAHQPSPCARAVRWLPPQYAADGRARLDASLARSLCA